MRTTSYLALLMAVVALGPGRGAAPTSSPPADLRPPPPFAATVEYGYDAWMLGGSRPQAGRWVRPESTPWFSLSDVDARSDTWFDAVDFTLRRAFADDYSGEFTLWSANVPSRWRAGFRRGRFVPEPSVGLLGSRGSLYFEGWISPVFGMLVELGYQNETVKLPGLARPMWALYDADEFRASASLPLGVGDLYAEFSNLNYRDRTPFQSASRTHQYGLTYSVMPGPRWLFGASGRWAEIDQPAVAASRLFSAGLTARFAPAHNLIFDSRLTFRDVTLGPTLNAYVAESLAGSATVTWHPWRRVNLKAGGERAAYERLDALQAVEYFGETKVWARADYRGNDGLRASARYQYRDLDGVDPTAVPGAFSTAALFCDREHQVDLRASVALRETGLAYGFYQWRERAWQGRGLTASQHTAGVGVAWPLGPRFQLSGDVFYAAYGSSAPGTAGLDADGFVYHVGALWTPLAWWQVTADYHRAESYFGENADQDFLSAGCDLDLGGGRWLRFGYRREDYTNATFGGLTYDADVVSVSLKSTL